MTQTILEKRIEELENVRALRELVDNFSILADKKEVWKQTELFTKDATAGSASALLGILPFLLGSITSPLVGMAGEYSAIPLGVIIFATSLLAVFFNAVLIKNGKPVPAPQEINLD
ncbi:hypothetical protein QFZ31_000086 [Neobacillus niacini]|nr:hypothetical protein [Neobacillus niacini]